MSLHGLLSVTIGVPNAGETGAYYADQLWTRKTSKARAACSPGDRRRPRPSSTPRTSRP